MRPSVMKKTLERSSSSQPHTRKSTGALDRDLFRIELGAFERMCIEVDTPRALTCYLLAKAGEWQQYLDLPSPYHDDDFPVNYGLTQMMRKNPRLPVRIDRRAVAISKFLDSEKHCAEVNERFKSMPWVGPSDPSMAALTLNVRTIIKRTLGRLNRNALDEIESNFRFGPGSSLDITGRDVLPSRKITHDNYSVTPRLLSLASPLLWPGATFYGAPASKITTVPKTVLTDRTIAVEPHMNIYVQLGIGKYMKKRLRKAGLQCHTRDANRKAALSARKRGLATVDLSSASDTISREVVWFLLPSDWFHLLYACRTDSYQLDGAEPVELEKFSSMGNGYTWELETLIFWAIAKAVVHESGSSDKLALAFGDDIIVPATCVQRLFEVLEFFGFQVNSQKSFWQGDFYESCGSDVFRDVDIRPCFFKGEILDLETSLVRVANAIRRYAHRIGYQLYCDSRYLTAYNFVVRHLTVGRRTGISEGYGDGGLVKNFDEFTPATAGSRKRWTGWEGFVGRILHRPPIQSDRTCVHGALNTALHFGTPELSRNIEYVRGGTGGPRLQSIPIPEWIDLGPWASRSGYSRD